MLTILGNRPTGSKFCDGLSRRNFLQIGGLGLTGLGLPQLLSAEAAGKSKKHKSVIMIYLVGGAPHQDMFDLKPEAPKEVAGPWRPIQTNVPGIEICEAFPMLAQQMDKAVIIRSIVGSQAGHDAIQCFNGHDPKKQKPGGGWPQFGSTISKLQGAVDQTAPPFVSLCYPCTHGPYNEPAPAIWGFRNLLFDRWEIPSKTWSSTALRWIDSGIEKRYSTASIYSKDKPMLPA